MNRNGVTDFHDEQPVEHVPARFGHANQLDLLDDETAVILPLKFMRERFCWGIKDGIVGLRNECSGQQDDGHQSKGERGNPCAALNREQKFSESQFKHCLGSVSHFVGEGKFTDSMQIQGHFDDDRQVLQRLVVILEESFSAYVLG